MLIRIRSELTVQQGTDSTKAVDGKEIARISLQPNSKLSMLSRMQSRSEDSYAKNENKKCYFCDMENLLDLNIY